MIDLLSGLLQVAVVVYAVTSMLSVGLGSSLDGILRPLRKVGAVVRVLVANFVLVPLLTFVILGLVSLDHPLEIGLILVATSAGAPFLVKLAEVAEAPRRITAALLVILLPATVIYMPIVVPLAIPGTAVRMSDIAIPLVLTMLLPLAAGVFVRTRWQSRAQRLRPIMGHTATVALLVLILATILANLPALVDLFGEGAILTALLVVGGALVIGYALGGPDPESRAVLGLGSAQRNIAAATVVATQSIGDPRTVVMVITAALAGFAILFPAARLLRGMQR